MVVLKGSREVVCKAPVSLWGTLTPDSNVFGVRNWSSKSTEDADAEMERISEEIKRKFLAKIRKYENIKKLTGIVQ